MEEGRVLVELKALPKLLGSRSALTQRDKLFRPAFQLRWMGLPLALAGRALLHQSLLRSTFWSYMNLVRSTPSLPHFVQ